MISRGIPRVDPLAGIGWTFYEGLKDNDCNGETDDGDADMDTECDDLDPCTTDTCDPEEGCVHTPIEGCE